MKRRNFLKWFVAIPAAWIASRLPIENPSVIYAGSITKRIDPEWAPKFPDDLEVGNSTWYKVATYTDGNGEKIPFFYPIDEDRISLPYIKTESSGNIKKFIKPD